MGNPARKRERRVGWTAVAFALMVNLLLFLAMAWANAPKTRRPVPPEYVVREIFQAAPPPAPPPPAEDPPATATDVVAPPLEIALPYPAPAQSFDPRVDLPSLPLDLPAPRLAIPAPGLEPGLLAAERADRPPRRVSTPLPPYPAWARLRKLEGVVTLVLVVDERGTVRKVDVQSIDGDERFAEAAREAVRGWTYEAALLNGKPVPVSLLQRVRFQLLD
jgi:protein TonB